MMNLILEALLSAVAVMLFYILLRAIYCISNKAEFHIRQEILPCLFSLYIGMLVFLLLTKNMHFYFENTEGAMFLRIFIGSSISRNLNLEPFKTILQQLGDLRQGNMQFSPLLNLLVNLILFAPMPIFIKLSNRKIGSIAAVFITFLSIVLVEAIQYFTGRAADIDDVILNTVGAIIAVLIFDFIVKKRLSKKRTS